MAVAWAARGGGTGSDYILRDSPAKRLVRDTRQLRKAEDYPRYLVCDSGRMAPHPLSRAWGTVEVGVSMSCRPDADGPGGGRRLRFRTEARAGWSNRDSAYRRDLKLETFTTSGCR